MQYHNFKVTLHNFPWHVKTSGSLMCPPGSIGKKYGWSSGKHNNRFGGGWSYKLGIELGTQSFLLNLLWGYVRVSWRKPRER